MAEDKAKDDPYAARIRELIPINELLPDIQDRVIREAGRVQLKKNKKLFKQGQRDNYAYYLLEGEIEMQADKQTHNTIVSGTDQSRYAMAQLQPRQFTGVASQPSVVLQLPRDALDRYLILSQEKTHDGLGDPSGMQIEVSELDAEEDIDWMSRLLQSEIFSRMPTANIHQLFALLEPMEFKAGNVVVKQDEPGQDYYIIQEGTCQVSRRPASGGKEIKLAELRTGDSFGEEALLAETSRNATVSMITDGVLMKLSKQNFYELVMEPMLHAISYEEAEKQTGSGKAKWLDVRYKNEHARSAIEGSISLPLNMLRMQMDKLNRDTYYILYCDTGGRSSAAAFLLAGAGFDISYLRGGLVNNPGAADPDDVTNAPKPESKPAAADRSGDAGKKPAAKENLELDDKDLDPEVKLTYLEAEISRNNMDLERTANKKTMNDALKKVRAEAQQKLEAERAKLEVAKKAAQQEAYKHRQQEEEKLKRLQEEAKKRIEEEKKRLEQVYSQNAEEMKKLERMKQEAEEQLRCERERMEKEAAAAKNDKGETARLRKQLEDSRQAMEEEQKKRTRQQQEMEKKIQMQARQKLEEERKKMAAQYARNNQELEKARRDKAVAEAARQAAKKEAEKVISEYKSKYDKSRAEEEARLQAERKQLEEERRQIQATLKQVQDTREEAEKLKQAAMDEVSGLREKQKRSDAQKNQAAQAALHNEIRQAEAKLQKAKLNIAQSQQKSVKIQQQKRMNIAGLESNQSEHEELRKQLEQDLVSFKEELKVEEEEYANMRTQIEHMRRIKERAEEAKREAQMADSDLLADVNHQLGKRK